MAWNKPSSRWILPIVVIALLGLLVIRFMMTILVIAVVLLPVALAILTALAGRSRKSSPSGSVPVATAIPTARPWGKS